MDQSNQQKFYEACNKVRQAWGLRTSTFEQISNLMARAIHASIQPGVDQERADMLVRGMLEEWVRWRAAGFLLQAPARVSATISRWPNGNHYYVTLVGNGVDIQEKFNAKAEAESWLATQVRKLKQEGREVIRASATGASK